MNLDKLPFTFDKMINALNSGDNFSLSRWGDGEFMCIFQEHYGGGKNTDKHEYFPVMGQALYNILYTGGKGEMFALQSLACKDLGHLDEFNNLVNINTWSANAEILARNHARDTEFFDALQGRDVILVANGYFNPDLDNGFLVPFEYEFVEIPLVNCWLEHSLILEEIEPRKDCVILYCASMMANVLINELYSDKYTQLDAGSFLDPYVGRMTRRYHHDLNI